MSISAVIGEKKDYTLQNVEPTFKDQLGHSYREFEAKLEGLNGKTSEGSLCISKYLVDSEKTWFQKLHMTKMGKPPASSSRKARLGPGDGEGGLSAPNSASETSSAINEEKDEGFEQFLKDDFVPPTGVRKLIRTKIGDWPIYTILLAIVSKAV